MASQEIEVVHKRVREIIESLDGYKMTKNAVNKGQGQSGNADFTVLYRGIWIDIECKWDMWVKFPTKLSKNKKNLPTAIQSQQLQATDDAGGIALVVDRHTMDILPELFAALDIRPELFAALDSCEKDATTAKYAASVIRRAFPEMWHTQFATKIKEVNL